MSVGRSLPDNVVGFAAGLVVRRDLMELAHWLVALPALRSAAPLLLRPAVKQRTQGAQAPVTNHAGNLEHTTAASPNARRVRNLCHRQ
jgi:hypothetical protein